MSRLDDHYHNKVRIVPCRTVASLTKHHQYDYSAGREAVIYPHPGVAALCRLQGLLRLQQVRHAQDQDRRPRQNEDSETDHIERSHGNSVGPSSGHNGKGNNLEDENG